MSLLHVQRSPSPFTLDDVESTADSEEWSEESPRSRSLSECFFATRGAAVIIPNYDGNSPTSSRGCELETHLQLMMKLLRPHDTLSLAVRLQTQVADHVAYLALISVLDNSVRRTLLLGIDYYQQHMSIGVVLPLRAGSQVRLAGDGGVRVCSGGPFGRPEQSLLFRPVSVQTMWFVFQRLNSSLEEADELAAAGGGSALTVAPGSLRLKADAAAVEFYTQRIASADVLCTQWQQSPIEAEWAGELRAEGLRGRDGCETKEQSDLRLKLRQLMPSFDLEAVTTRDILVRLSACLPFEIDRHKDFIDREVLVIMGQMAVPSLIFDYLYLGTEWNACNWEELQRNNVGYILNVTEEVDNFFPNRFDYYKIPVADDPGTQLLNFWTKTHRFIKQARENGKSVLVHCKKGISRSSSTVIAYAMKEYGWHLEKAYSYVKERRSCIIPNDGFMEQLRTFGGALEASRNREIFTRDCSDFPEGGAFSSRSRTDSLSPQALEKSELYTESEAEGGRKGEEEAAESRSSEGQAVSSEVAVRNIVAAWERGEQSASPPHTQRFPIDVIVQNKRSSIQQLS